MSLLTPRQGQLLEFLQRFIERNGAPPTRAEIAAEMGFRSANAAEDHLKALARKGAIELVPGTSRGIRLRQAGLPLVGRVAAGSPILAEQHIEEYYQIEAGLFYPAADYLLRVRGASMRDAGILDGDLLAVHRSDDAANGQIVVRVLKTKSPSSASAAAVTRSGCCRKTPISSRSKWILMPSRLASKASALA